MISSQFYCLCDPGYISREAGERVDAGSLALTRLAPLVDVDDPKADVGWIFPLDGGVVAVGEVNCRCRLW